MKRLALAAALLFLLPPAQAQTTELPPNYDEWAHEAAHVLLWECELSHTCGDRDIWHFRNTLWWGIYFYDQLPVGEGEGAGEHLGRVYVRHASYWLGRPAGVVLSHYDKLWYDLTGECESGNNPFIDTGNGYLGEVQWLQSTWDGVAVVLAPELAGFYVPHVQRFIQRRFALYLRDYVGRGQWPSCAYRI